MFLFLIPPILSSTSTFKSSARQNAFLSNYFLCGCRADSFKKEIFSPSANILYLFVNCLADGISFKRIQLLKEHSFFKKNFTECSFKEVGDVNCGPRNHFLFPPFGSWALTYSSQLFSHFIHFHPHISYLLKVEVEVGNS